MNWLVTLTKDADLEKVIRAIESVGGKLDSDLPEKFQIDDDIVLAVKGPDNFSEILKRASKDVLGVYPNSDVSLY